MRQLLIVLLFGSMLLPNLIVADCMDSVWVIGPGSLNADLGSGIALASDGNVLIGGYYDLLGITQGFGWLIKLNPADGSQIWSETYSVDSAQSVFLDVAATDDGGFICGGWYRMPVTNDQQYWLYRVNADGDSLWSRGYGHEFSNQARAVVQSTDGGFAIAGRAVSLPGGFGETDWWILKTDENGDSLWSQVIGSPLEETLLDMILTPAGNYLLVGHSLTDSTREGRVAEISATGEILWDHVYSPEVAVVLESAVVADEGYVLCGNTTPRNGTNDVLLMAIDHSGNELWHQIINLLPDRNDVATAIRSDGMGGYYVFGHGYRRNTTEKDVFVLHVSVCGDIISTRWIGNAVDEEIWDAEVTPSGMIVTSGLARLSPTQLELQAYGVSMDTCNAPPCEFARIAPQDSVLLDTAVEVTFTWSRAIDNENEPVSYLFHLESNYTLPIEPADTVTADTFVTVTISIPVTPLDEVFDFHWQVRATDGQDTIEANNGEGYFQMDIPQNTDMLTVYPSSFSLSAFPNPFNAETTLSFALPFGENVSLVLYNLQGRVVKSLVNEKMASGVHTITFDGRELASGIYFASLRTPTHTRTTKLVLLK